MQGDPLLTANHTIPIFLVGDSAYPLLRWLIKPFPESPILTNRQKTFNYRICCGRIVVEMAFGRLKAHWRRLSKQNDMSIGNVPNVVAACCVLHNICEIRGDEFNGEWLQEVEEMLPSTSTSPSTCTYTSTSGTAVRDTLVNYFVLNPL